MAEQSSKSEAKSDVAKEKPRDSEGHFIHQAQESAKKVLSHLEKNVDYNKNQDDLLNVHVGNPLQRITHLLEEIKKQKAFAFTLKGSLGIAGIAVALSVFGFFGGSKILCDKGIQTQIGTIKVLKYQESEESNLPFIGWAIDYFSGKLGRSTVSNRIVLEFGDNDTIHIPNAASLTQFSGQKVYATGSYDSCSQTLKVDDIEQTTPQ